MATKIRRCLYVGLGGTGMSALLNTKRTFLETYGEVPPMIGFLGIDTDGGAYKKELDSKYGKVKLSPDEQLPIRVDDARPIYEVNKNHFGWLPEENLYALTSMTLGAGQVRSNGRFALTVNHVDIENKIKRVIGDITNATITNNLKYDLLSTEVEIHMIFSVCGGTGCGTFLNMAYLLKKCAPQCKLTGYGILPDVFEAMSTSGMAKVKPNAYGAIQDLDWLMHLNLNSDKVAFDYINYVQHTNEKPFNAFFFIDNKNSNNDTYLHVDQLTEMVSLALVTSAGELSTAAASVSDNLEKNIREGSMDIENKKAWAAGLGVCEIMFHGEDLKDIYANKSAKRVIERLLNSCIDTDVVVNAWIDSPDVNIRENNGFDNVIDFILSKQPSFQFTTIDDKANATSEVDSYLNTAKPKDGIVDTKIKELSNRVSCKLQELIKKEINQECGIGGVENIIIGIQSQVNLFLDEMNSEVEELKEQLPKIDSSLKIAINDLSEYNGKFFKKKSTLEDYANSVMEIATRKAICEREIIRRNAAITFYNGLQTLLIEAFTKVGNIKRMLIGISSELTNKITEIQNRIGRASQTFQIDLAQKYVGQVQIKDEEIQVQEFLKGLAYENKIFDFDAKKSSEIIEVLLNYTNKLTTSRELANMTIDRVLDEMDNEVFEQTLRMAINKSNPLLRFDYRGYTPNERPSNSYYIGVPSKNESRLYKDDNFKQLLQGNIDVDFANIGVKDRVIIYRQLGVLPAYALSSLATYKDKYDNCNCCCHFDITIYNKMQREDYNLYPKVASDDSIELWVKGFIFNLIKNENNKYYFVSEELGDALDDNWVELAQYRDEAFEMFKRNKATIRKEFNEFFNHYQKTKGAENMQVIVDDAKSNYYLKYSQINLTKDEIKQKGFEAIRKLITEELEYVKKEL